ncbi:MAG: glycosyltransferase family 4 protein [Streptosporangiaceae bacterium]
MIGLRTESNSSRSIVHISSSYPPALGGAEQVIQSIARNQHKLGMQVRVLTSDQGRNDLLQEDELFPVSRLKSVNIAHTPIIPSLLPRLLNLDRSSIIHLHVSCAYTPEIVWIYARIRSRPYVAHVHLDVLRSGRAGSLLGPYKLLLLRRVLRDATVVLVPTSDYRQLICDKYGIPQERVVVSGCGTEHVIAERPKSLSGERKERRLLFVGRLSVQKNIPLMLEAIAVYVRKYGDEVSLAIVGEGEIRPAVQSQIKRLGLGDVVTLHGRLHGEALQSAYEDSDLLLLTSANESFGLVFIEAMTKGLPIVSVNIPAVRNVVINGVNGLLAESTPETVAAAIHTLLVDKVLYSAVSRNNLAKSRDYDWKAIAEDLASVYDAV